MAKKKSKFNESFTQGIGTEMGKRTGTIVFGLAVFVIAALLGLRGCDTSSSETSTPAKSYGNNGNVD